MSQAPLPRQVDVRKLAQAERQISALEPLASFTRFCDLLAGNVGEISIDLAFYVSEEGVRAVDGSVRGEVGVICQRCLGPMTVALDSRFSVGVVWSDEEARNLVRRLEPWELGEAPHDLLELVEDELIMSLPFVSYHPPEQCPAGSPSDEVAAGGPPRRENPFRVLQRLKPGAGEPEQ